MMERVAFITFLMMKVKMKQLLILSELTIVHALEIKCVQLDNSKDEMLFSHAVANYSYLGDLLRNTN